MPKVTYVENKKKSFINPYNFVKPDADVIKGEVSEKGELVTGKLHCKMYIKTPIAIPNTDEKEIVRDDNGHPHYKFMKTLLDGKEVLYIPGSSIRGCVRSMYETVTNSCFATLPQNAYLTNRSAARDAYNPSILIKEGDEWSLFDAERLLVDTNKKSFKIIYEGNTRKLKYNDKKFIFGDCVSIDYSGNKVNSLSYDNDNTNYVLYIGEPFTNRRHNESVFKKGKKLPVDVTQLNSAINRLDYSIEMYGKKSINRQLGSNKHTGYSAYRDARNRGIIPVWYKKVTKDGKIIDISLSIAAIGRKVYKNTVNDLIGLGLIACHADKEDRDASLCPACQLFGTVRGSGYGSHVRFTDAICTDEMGEKPVSVTLKELGSPRTGYLPFYALKGIDYDLHGTNINGRKFYWHNPQASKDKSIYTEDSKKERNERNATVEVLNNGLFEFDVYFDEISKDQLNTLIWTLSLGENNEESKYCYKIGHGKPIGLGSVKICVSEQIFRTYSNEFNYSVQNDIEVTVPNGTKLLNDSAKKQIQIISDFELLRGMDIRYPYIDHESNTTKGQLKENDLASHQWFSHAKDSKTGKAIILPEIANTKEKPLHPYSVYPQNNAYQGNNDHHEKKNGSNTGKNKNHSLGNNNVNRKTNNTGDIFEGEITGFNSSGKFATVMNQHGDSVSFYCGGKATIGEKVRLKKTGVNNKGYDTWKRIGKS